MNASFANKNTDNILISIIVPVYNTEDYLETCIKSLICQTHRNLQIILIDDGSSDHSSNICENFAAIDGRITVIHQKNAGQSAARNVGISCATGAYLGFIDSDDFIEADMYKSMLQAALHYDADIVSCGMFKTDETGSTPQVAHNLPCCMQYSPAMAAQEVLTFGQLDVSCCDKLFKRDLFQSIRFPEGQINEDAYVLFQLLPQSNRLVHIGAPKYYYRQHSKSTSKSTYSPRRAVLMDNAYTFEANLLPCFPHLRNAFRKYRAYIALDLLCVMLKDPAKKHQYKSDYIRFIRELRCNILFLYANRNISFAWKARGTAIALGVYGFLYQLLRKN